jgi:hypothetical protein
MNGSGVPYRKTLHQTSMQSVEVANPYKSMQHSKATLLSVYIKLHANFNINSTSTGIQRCMQKIQQMSWSICWWAGRAATNNWTKTNTICQHNLMCRRYLYRSIIWQKINMNLFLRLDLDLPIYTSSSSRFVICTSTYVEKFPLCRNFEAIFVQFPLCSYSKTVPWRQSITSKFRVPTWFLRPVLLFH